MKWTTMNSVEMLIFLMKVLKSPRNMLNLSRTTPKLTTKPSLSSTTISPMTSKTSWLNLESWPLNTESELPNSSRISISSDLEMSPESRWDSVWTCASYHFLTMSLNCWWRISVTQKSLTSSDGKTWLMPLTRFSLRRVLNKWVQSRLSRLLRPTINMEREICQKKKYRLLKPYSKDFLNSARQPDLI